MENQKIIAGECKTNNGFSKKDFINALLLSNIGVDEFYFCTLSELSDNTFTMVENFKSKLKNKQNQMKIFTLSSKEMLK